MKTRFVIIVALLCSLDSYSQPESIWQVLHNGQIIRWAYSFGDEFNGTTLDDSKWQNHYPWGRNHDGPSNHLEYMTDGQNISFGHNSTINSGTLRLTAKDEDVYARGVPYESDNFSLGDGSPNLRWWNYTSGMIFSKQKFKYGLFEIRFKIPSGVGLFPAFWLYGGNPDEEFDIFECKGERTNQLHWDVHCPGSACGPTVGGWVTASSGSFANGFNSVMGEWSPGMLFWYCNGREFAYWLGDLNYQAHLIANLNLNGPTGPFQPAVSSSTPYPSTFEIDYIRVFNKINCEQSINICNYNHILVSPTVMTGSQISLGGTSSCSAELGVGENLDLIATDNIQLLPGADIQGTLSTKIITCPGPKNTNPIPQEDQFPGNSANSGDIIIGEDLNKSALLPEQESNSGHAFYTKIFPNPTQGKINIEFEGQIKGNVEIKMINSMDQTVFIKSGIKESFSIDISSLPKGTYFLIGTFGENSVSEKIILE